MQFALTVLDGVRWQGRPVAGARPQALLAALVRGDRGPVGDRGLIEAVWEDTPPADPAKALQVLVSRTRAACATEVIIRDPAGYRLGPPPEQVDALALARAVDRVRGLVADGATADAIDLAERALAVPVALEPDASPAVIAELRAAARDRRAELARLLGIARSRAGDHAAALELLEPLVGGGVVAPEPVLAALLRSEAAVRGPAAALERFESHRRDLADRWGTDPGPELRRVHAHLLALDRPVRTGVQYEPAGLIGRDDDVRAVLGLLDAHRVVSIIGPGGLGKTRLAHTVGRAAGQPVVRLVELVGIGTDDEVILETASVLGVRDSITSRRLLTPAQRGDLRARIAEKLSGAPTLLIIDNCEHVIDGVARLVSLLVANVPDLAVLTTSRAPLAIAAERTYPLPQLGRDDGIALFRQRAVAVRPDAVLDEAAIGDLVDRLDGLPLAVELAAARIRVMSVAEITARLGDRFALLRSRDPAAPDRHRTLEAVIDWSAALLSEPGRRALRRLAAFRDGFGLDAAAAVIGGDPVPILEELADQSLITVEEGAAVRYRMLETVREYGLLQLRRRGETTEVDAAVRAWAVGLCREQFALLHGPGQYSAADRLAAEEGNLNEVLRQAIATGDAEAVVLLLAPLSGFWWMIGDHHRLIGLVDAVPAVLADYQPPAEVADAARTTAAALLSNAAIFSGGATAPAPIVELFRRIGPGSNDPRIVAEAELIKLLSDGTDESDRISRLTELTETGERRLALAACQWLLHLAENEGEPRQAIRAGERGLRLCRPEDGPWVRGALLNSLAEVHIQIGDHTAAERYATEALPILERLHATDDAAHLRGLLAMAALQAGRIDDADRLISRLRDWQSRSPMHGGSTVLATADAELAFARGDVAAGLDHYRRALPRVRELRLPGSVTGEYAPWLLMIESAALRAFHRYGAADEAAELYRKLLGKLAGYLAPEVGFTDYPVVGTVLFGLSVRVAEDDPELAARLFTYGRRFGVVHTLPSTGPDEVAKIIERSRPGLLDRIAAELGDRSPRELRGRLYDLVRELAGRDGRSA